MSDKTKADTAAGVIFDLDGTLANTLEDITDAINELLRDIGQNVVSTNQVRPLVGDGLPQLVERITGITDHHALSALAERYQPVYTRLMLNKSALYPGVDRLLTALQSANAPMCVLSNKPHAYTAPMCDALLAPWPFVRCIGHRPDWPRKPDPASALWLARQMNRAPQHVRFVGDSSVDITTGHNADMKTIAVTWGYRDRPELVDANAHRIVDSADQLIEALLSE